MKKIIAMLLALVMVLGLAACGGSSAPAATEAPAAAAPAATEAAAPAADGEKVTVNIVAAQYGTETANWWVGFEQKFEEANPDIDLIVDVISWNDIATVVQTRIANGEQPDLLNIDGFAPPRSGYPPRPMPSSTTPSLRSLSSMAPSGQCPIWLPPVLCMSTPTFWLRPVWKSPPLGPS